jgi:hypothetical protein
VVREQALLKTRAGRCLTYTSFEEFLLAKVLVEGLRRAGSGADAGRGAQGAGIHG